MSRPTLLYDGYCNLCVGWVGFVLRHSPPNTFTLHPFQSVEGKALLHHRLKTENMPETLVFIDDAGLHTKSTAILRALTHTHTPAWLIALANACPRSVRDGLYDWVGQHRYRLFGKRARCHLPPQT